MTKQGLISKIQKQHIKLNIKKTPKIFFKKMRRPKETFFQGKNTDRQPELTKMLNIANRQ